MSYTVYTLSKPAEKIVWKDVRYIGISIDVDSRFQEHLSCSDSTNPDKNAWIRGLLEQGQQPTLGTIEQVETKQEALTQEQYWIRYAIGQGAALLNWAIAYTEGERAEIHRQRAICYALVEELLSRGVYVKRTAVWYPSSLLNQYQRYYQRSSLDILDSFFTTSEGKKVAVNDATDAEFDTFIRQYIPVVDLGEKVWDPFGERTNAIQFAWGCNKTPALFTGHDPEE